MNITQIDAATGENTIISLTEAEYAKLIGDLALPKSIAEDVEEKAALKQSALAKLTALGLTEEEAKAIIG